MSIVLWLGSFLLGKSKRAAGGIAVAALIAIVGLGAALGLKTWTADRTHDRLAHERDQARIDLGACQELNRTNAARMDEINRQAEANARAAELERVRAEIARRELAEQQETADARHQAELDALRDALDADDCAGRIVPADVDRLFRQPPAG